MWAGGKVKRSWYQWQVSEGGLVFLKRVKKGSWYGTKRDSVKDKQKTKLKMELEKNEKE